jgi:hypothetical protein
LNAAILITLSRRLPQRPCFPPSPTPTTFGLRLLILLPPSHRNTQFAVEPLQGKSRAHKAPPIDPRSRAVIEHRTQDQYPVPTAHRADIVSAGQSVVEVASYSFELPSITRFFGSRPDIPSQHSSHQLCESSQQDSRVQCSTFVSLAPCENARAHLAPSIGSRSRPVLRLTQDQHLFVGRTSFAGLSVVEAACSACAVLDHSALSEATHSLQLSSQIVSQLEHSSSAHNGRRPFDSRGRTRQRRARD